MVNLVPRQDLVARNMERIANGLWARQKAHERLCEVLMMRQYPQRCPVAVHHDRPPPPHSVHDRPASLKRDHSFVVGV